MLRQESETEARLAEEYAQKRLKEKQAEQIESNRLPPSAKELPWLRKKIPGVVSISRTQTLFTTRLVPRLESRLTQPVLLPVTPYSYCSPPIKVKSQAFDLTHQAPSPTISKIDVAPRGLLESNGATGALHKRLVAIPPPSTLLMTSFPPDQTVVNSIANRHAVDPHTPSRQPSKVKMQARGNVSSEKPEKVHGIKRVAAAIDVEGYMEIDVQEQMRPSKRMNRGPHIHDTYQKGKSKVTVAFRDPACGLATERLPQVSNSPTTFEAGEDISNATPKMLEADVMRQTLSNQTSPSTTRNSLSTVTEMKASSIDNMSKGGQDFQPVSYRHSSLFPIEYVLNWVASLLRMKRFQCFLRIPYSTIQGGGHPSASTYTRQPSQEQWDINSQLMKLCPIPPLTTY
jgi:hypothetical protein